MKATLRPERGFTLIELLAAVAIFAMMAVLAYGGLSAVLKARGKVTGSLERTAEFQMTIFRLQSDMEQARNRSIRNEFGDTEAPFLVTQDGLVVFTRGGLRNPRLEQRSNFERVAYGLKDKHLVRYSWPTLDRAQGQQMVETPLLDHVKTLTWRFLDAQREWQPTWPPLNSSTTAGYTLPLAVEMTLEAEDWGEIHYLFRIISAPFAAPPNSGIPPPGKT